MGKFVLSISCIAVLAIIFFLALQQKTTLFSPTVNNPFAKKLIAINESGQAEIDVSVTTLPQFALSLVDKKFSNLWESNTAQRVQMVQAKAFTTIADKSLEVIPEFDADKKSVILTPKIRNSIKPGLYQLDIKIKTVTGEYATITQDFRWGVLAINTDKASYVSGEEVTVGMAVLDDLGKTKCIETGSIIGASKAKLWLTVILPSGKKQQFSTDDKQISGSTECAERSFTNVPDFSTSFTASEVGTYKLLLESETILGKNKLSDQFVVLSTPPPFVIKRSQYPIRIYPRMAYPVEITIRANEDYSGKVEDLVPSSFTIYNFSENGKAIVQGDYQKLSWDVEWKKGQTYTLSYRIKFPQITPEFYLVGPIHIGTYKEERSWQIASDTLFAFVQEKHNTTNSGTSVQAVLDNTPIQNNLMVLICYRTSSNSFTTPAGWTSAYNNSSGPRMYMYYRVAPAGMSTTVTCSAGTSGTLGIQVLEFSGNATSSVRDTRSRRNNINCSGGTMNSASTTPSNIDVLLISSYSATSTRTVSGHASSFTDSQASFNPTTGTFDSAWKEAINNPPVSNSSTATYSGNAGTCDNLIVGFNAQIAVSQGSYRFFANANSAVQPGSALAAQDTTITLSRPNQQFRLRILLDVDSPSGNTIGATTGAWALQYAVLDSGGSCSTATYDFVGAVSDGTEIAYNPNSLSGGNNTTIDSTNSANDPSDGGYTTVYENYIENWLSDGSEDVTNNATISDAQAGLFDFSLVENVTVGGTRTYCLRITDGGGGVLDAYSAYPQVTTVTTDVLIRGGTTIKGGTTLR